MHKFGVRDVVDVKLIDRTTGRVIAEFKGVNIKDLEISVVQRDDKGEEE